MTYDKWFEKYKPILDEDDNYVEVEFGDTDSITRNLLNHCIWTELDTGELVPGTSFINRVRYILTRKSWSVSDLSTLEVSYDDL